MSRQLIKGETIPLEIFSEEIQAVARGIADRALAFSGVIPPGILAILSATDEQLRSVQLHNQFRYVDLEELSSKPENNLDFIELLDSAEL